MRRAGEIGNDKKQGMEVVMAEQKRLSFSLGVTGVDKNEYITGRAQVEYFEDSLELEKQS